MEGVINHARRQQGDVGVTGNVSLYATLTRVSGCHVPSYVWLSFDVGCVCAGTMFVWNILQKYDRAAPCQRSIHIQRQVSKRVLNLILSSLIMSDEQLLMLQQLQRGSLFSFTSRQQCLRAGVSDLWLNHFVVYRGPVSKVACYPQLQLFDPS